MRPFSRLVLVVSVFALTFAGFAQQTSTSVPNLISYSGTLKNVRGPAQSSRVVGISFLIYKQQEGGAPLWMETQNVSVDGSGHYSVSLGSTKTEGIPSDLFSPQEERWLAVQVEGQAEQARVLLVSVPYAFKAHEAETLGGLPASAYLTTNSLQTISQTLANLASAQSSGPQQSGAGIRPATLGHGTQGYIAMWQNSVYLRNSGLFQDLNQNVGIGTTTPAAKLDVIGGVSASVYDIGGRTVMSSDTVKENLFLGFGAGVNTSGDLDTFIGLSAGQFNTSGTNNTFTGVAAGWKNTTGNFNTFTGVNAGIQNTTASFNTFTGVGAGDQNTTGSANTITRASAGFFNTNGTGNAFYGQNAGLNNATGSFNVFLGFTAGAYNTTGSNDIYIGHLGCGNGCSENSTIRIGGDNQQGYGPQTAAYIAGVSGALTSSGVPVFIDSTGKLGTAGGGINFSQLTGTLGNAQLTGTYGNALTLNNASDSFTGTFVGNGAGLTGVQPAAGSPNYVQNGTTQQQASFNINGNGILGGMISANLVSSATSFVIGGTSVLGTPGIGNTFTGAGAGQNSAGSDNTYSGSQAGIANLNGGQNSFFGANAGSNGVSGNGNTFVGYQAGFISRGNGNIFIGNAAGANNTTGSSNIYIGNTGPANGTENTTIRIGTTGLFATYIGGIYQSPIGSNGVAVFVDSNGQLGTTASSRRFKEQIRDMGDSTNGLMKLRPVTFVYKPGYDKGLRTLQYGLIAEEVAEVYPDLVAYQPDGQPYTVKYQYLTTMLLNEVQK